MTVESYIRCGVGRTFAMIKFVSYIWLCDPLAWWYQCISVWILLLILLLGLLCGSPFLSVANLLSFWSDECHWWSLLSISLKPSGNCLSNVGIKLSHLKYKESIHMLYSLLICWASPLNSLIRCLCTLLIWTLSMKLICFMQVLDASFIILEYSTWASHFQHYRLGVTVHWEPEVLLG